MHGTVFEVDDLLTSVSFPLELHVLFYYYNRMKIWFFLHSFIVGLLSWLRSQTFSSPWKRDRYSAIRQCLHHVRGRLIICIWYRCWTHWHNYILHNMFISVWFDWMLYFHQSSDIVLIIGQCLRHVRGHRIRQSPVQQHPTLCVHLCVVWFHSML